MAFPSYVLQSLLRHHLRGKRIFLTGKKNFPLVTENNQAISERMKKLFQNIKSDAWDIKGSWNIDAYVERKSFMPCSILDTGYIKREMRQLMSWGNSSWKKNWTIIIIAQIDMWTINNIGESGIVKKKKNAYGYGKNLHNWNMLHRVWKNVPHQEEIKEQTANAKVPSWKARISSGNDSLSEHEEGNRRWR